MTQPNNEFSSNNSKVSKFFNSSANPHAIMSKFLRTKTKYVGKREDKNDNNLNYKKREQEDNA